MAIWSLSGFSWIDYVVFALLLVFSLGIGIFYALRDRGQAKSTKDYLMAGKSMAVAPATLSFIASFMSAIMLLGSQAPASPALTRPARSSLFTRDGLQEQQAHSIASSEYYRILYDRELSRISIFVVQFLRNNRYSIKVQYEYISEHLILTGTPAEQYTYGSQYWLIIFAYAIMVISSIILVLYCTYGVFTVPYISIYLAP